jgi:hypothetical protein
MKVNLHALTTPMFNAFMGNVTLFVLNYAKIIYIRTKYG